MVRPLTEEEYKRIEGILFVSFGINVEDVERLRATIEAGGFLAVGEEDLYAWATGSEERKGFTSQDLPLMLAMAGSNRLPFNLYFDSREWVVEVEGAWAGVHYKCKSLGSVARTLAALIYGSKKGVDTSGLMGDE